MEQPRRREIDQVSQELGRLHGHYTALQSLVEKTNGDVEALTQNISDLKADSAERRSMLEQLVDDVREIGEAVAHLNDVDRKLLEVGFRADDAKSHRQDQIFIRRWRRFFEFVGRHAGKALVGSVVAGIAGLALGNYPPAAKLLEAILGHLAE